MCCLLCKSNFHISQNCKKYSSNNSRIKFANKNNRCRFCFTLLDVPHNSYDNVCKKNRNCYKCFTAAHHTLLCTQKTKGWNFFIPNINRIALQRLLKIFNDDPCEQYILAFLSPETCDLIPLNPLKVIHRKEIKNVNFADEFFDSNILINGVITVLNITHNENFLTDVICQAPFVNFENSLISTTDFFHLLSPCTKYLKCKFLTLTKSVRLADMLQKIPNIVNLEIETPSIIVENTWPKVLLDIHNKLEVFTITTDDINFDEDTLARTLGDTNLKVQLKIDVPVGYNYASTCEIVTEKFYHNFDLCTKNTSVLSVFIARNPGNEYELFQYYKLH